MRINEIYVEDSVEQLDYESAIKTLAQVQGLHHVLGTGPMNDNLIRSVLLMIYPRHSHNEIKKDWTQAVRQATKKEKFKHKLKGR